MYRFRYRFERILELKERMEDIAKNEFGQAVRALNVEREMLEKIVSVRKEAIEEFKSSGGRVIFIEDILQYQIYMSRLNRMLKNQQEMVKNATAKVEEKRVKLIKASQEKKTFEKIKERDYGQYLSEENVAEQNEMDDIGSQRFIRNAGNA